MEKNIFDLKQERAQVSKEIDALVKKEGRSDEDKNKLAELRTAFYSFNEEIDLMEENERIQAKAVGKEFDKEERSTMGANLIEEFRSFLSSSDKEFRANFTSTTDTDLVEKGIAPVNTKKSTSKDFLLNELGVTFYTDKKGNFVLPYSDDSLASMPSEGADASTFSYTFGQTTLAPKRFSTTYTVSLESTENVGDSTILDIITKLDESLWNKVEDYYYDQFVVDASGRAIDTSTNHWANALELEEKADGLVYIAPKTLKSTLKAARIDSGSGRLVWEGNEMNGYPAYGRRYANTGQVLFFDPAATAISQFGPVKIIKDEVTSAKKGEIIFTATGLFDCGIANPYLVSFAEGLA
jgi:hypothetical protein